VTENILPYEGRSAETMHLMSLFEWGHLPPHLQEVSKASAELAGQMVSKFSDGYELSFGLRQLLLAKDAFVRAMVAERDSFNRGMVEERQKGTST
jgi:hypothetical protein